MGEAEVDITAVGARGDGVGDYAGTRVYVAGALPGERHRLRLAERDRHGIRGHTREGPFRAAEANQGGALGR